MFYSLNFNRNNNIILLFNFIYNRVLIGNKIKKISTALKNLSKLKVL